MTRINENHIELWVIEVLQGKGFTFIPPEQLDPDHSTQLRSGFADVVIESHLQSTLQRVNPHIAPPILQQAIKEVLRAPGHGDLITGNQYFQTLLCQGVDVSYQDKGEERTIKAKLIDELNPANNHWCVTHQVTIMENGQHKRPDIILYLNGLPIVVMELKNAADHNATIDKAYQQLQTYHRAIPGLFYYNCFEIISDGLEAKMGTITSDISRFMAWKTADGKTLASNRKSELAVMMDGLLNPQTLTDLILNFIVFEKTKAEDLKTKTIRIEVIKKIATYHQYYAVKKAILSTQTASNTNGNRKGGVVWHTQGSGKSLSMVFFTGLLVKTLDNPTIVVITDRNDLDEQLFETFAACAQLLRQVPVQIESRQALVKELRDRQSGGIFFTTIQKFLPDDGSNKFEQLSSRRNIIVIADEAHRTQYGFEAKTRYIKDEAGNQTGTEIVYGFAKHMHDALPAATFIGFTGTPVESNDRNTKAVFGEYVDVYDIERAVLDGATVPIYYENRFAKLKLDQFLSEKMEEEFLVASEPLPDYITKHAIENATRQETIVGHPERLKLIAKDIITHFEERATVFNGKALIVAMNRRIAVALYNEMLTMRPEWHDTRDEYGSLKVIMTGSSADEAFLQDHIRGKEKRSLIAARLKERNDPLQMVIVVDMWLTGFDAPVLHTLYLDKDMGGHNLMQAIARVNRVFNDKPGGLIVDYVPVTGNLKAALKTYTENQGNGAITLDIAEAVNLMLTKLEVIRQMYHGFDYAPYFEATTGPKMDIILEAEEHVLGLENGKERYIREVTALSKAYALSKSEPEADRVTQEVSFFQAVKARLAKFDMEVTGQRRKEFEDTIKSMVESAIATDGIVNLLDQAGLAKPTVSIFSEDFMNDIRNMKQKNVAIELLKKLLADQIKIRFKKNVVVNKSLIEKLMAAINKYNNKSITALEMMELLLYIAHEVNHETEAGEAMGLTDAEKAFYDALACNTSALQMMGDAQLVAIAKELVKRVKNSTTTDWTVRQSAKDRVKLEVKRVLRSHKYPPDDEKRATDTVLEQAEMFAGELV